MKVHIAIDTKTFVRFWLVLIGFVLVIAAIYNARSALLLIGLALFLALALNAPVSYIAHKLPGRSRVGATALAYSAVVLVLAAVVFLVIPPIADQTSRFISSAPNIIDNLSHQWAAFGDFAKQYNLQDQVERMVVSAKESLESFAVQFGGNIIGGIGSFFSLVFSVVLVLTMAFLMLIEGPEWLKKLWGIYSDPEKMAVHKRVVTKMYNVVTGYVTGQLTVSGIDAFCGGFVVFVLSLLFPAVPGSLAFPTIAILFTLSLIPLFGATLGGVLVSLLLITNNLTAGVIFGIYFIVYQQVENNFISPVVQSKKLELSPLIVLVAVTVGVYVFGLLGGIISIPVAGCVKVLFEEYLASTRGKREEAEKPLAKLVEKLKGDATV